MCFWFIYIYIYISVYFVYVCLYTYICACILLLSFAVMHMRLALHISYAFVHVQSGLFRKTPIRSSNKSVAPGVLSYVFCAALGSPEGAVRDFFSPLFLRQKVSTEYQEHSTWELVKWYWLSIDVYWLMFGKPNSKPTGLMVDNSTQLPTDFWRYWGWIRWL